MNNMIKNCVENLSRSKNWLEKEQELRSFITHCDKNLNDGNLSEDKKQGVRTNKRVAELNLAYMEEVVNLVNEIMVAYRITSKVRLDRGNSTEMYPGLGFYNLTVHLFEHGAINNPENKVKLATNICHEMGHLINGDVKFFTAARGVTQITKELNKNKGKTESPLHHRACIVLQVLSECRADFFGKKGAMTLYNGCNFDWVKGDKHYAYTGYLPAIDRKTAMEHFAQYDANFVDYMFTFYFEKDGYLSRDILEEYLRSSKVTAIPKSWAYQLLMGETM